MKYYAIKRPDGSWVMAEPASTKQGAWVRADDAEAIDHYGPTWITAAEAAGYRCVEVDGFREVEK